MRILFPCVVLLLASSEGMSQRAQRAAQVPPSGTLLHTTVCILAHNQNSIGARTMLRVRGHIYRVFDEFVIRNNGCSFTLELPAAGAMGSQRKTGAPPSGAASGASKGAENLRKLRRYVDARVAPVEKGAACLVCGRYRVRATLVGRLGAPGKLGVDDRPEPGAKLMARRLVIQAVSHVRADDLHGGLYSPDEYTPVPQN